MRLSLDAVERELGRLWDAETRHGAPSRIGLQTLVALVSEPEQLERAQRVVDEVACAVPLRTIVAVWRSGGAPAITGDVALHHPRGGGVACGDAITIEAIGDAREWIPGNAERLSLPDLPVCMWWVGDLPDYDHLFDKMVVGADLVVVNSQEMDLRDLHKLSSIARGTRRYAFADLTWIRLRWLQDLVARFFDDEAGRAWLPKVQRVTIEYSPRPGGSDAASTLAGLLFGWIAHALGVHGDGATWKRAEGWAEVTVGQLVARFEPRPRPDVLPGGIVRLAIEGPGARFQVERLADPETFRWSRELPGVPTPPLVVHVQTKSVDEAALLLGCVEHPIRDALLEASLQVASRLCLPVAPRLSEPPEG